MLLALSLRIGRNLILLNTVSTFFVALATKDSASNVMIEYYLLIQISTSDLIEKMPSDGFV